MGVVAVPVLARDYVASSAIVGPVAGVHLFFVLYSLSLEVGAQIWGYVYGSAL
jgi:hypothetical protein